MNMYNFMHCHGTVSSQHLFSSANHVLQPVICHLHLLLWIKSHDTLALLSYDAYTCEVFSYKEVFFLCAWNIQEEKKLPVYSYSEAPRVQGWLVMWSSYYYLSMQFKHIMYMYCDETLECWWTLFIFRYNTSMSSSYHWNMY